jgi:hypothetical protein
MYALVRTFPFFTIYLLAYRVDGTNGSSKWCSDLVRFHSSKAKQGQQCGSIPAASELTGFNAPIEVRDRAGSPSFLSRSGVDWWVWTNHARFMGNPGVFVDASANGDRTSTLVLERCLRWQGMCTAAPNAAGANMTACATTVTRPLSSSNFLSAHDYVDLLVWDVAAHSNFALDVGLFAADILIVIRPSFGDRHAEAGLLGGLKDLYRKLRPQGLGDDAAGVAVDVFLRSGFELNSDREGLGAVRRESTAAATQGLLSCLPTRKSPVVSQYKVARVSGVRNSGWGSLLMDCVRHLPSTFPLSRLADAFVPGKRFPQTIGRHITVTWLPLREANKTDIFTDFFPITHMNWESGSSMQICRGTSYGAHESELEHIGVVSPETGFCTGGRTSLGVSASEVDQFEGLFWKTTWSTFGLQAVPKEASLPSDFATQSRSSNTGYACLMKLINMHILPADREMIARVTGYPFQSALDVLQRSSKGYFARFLSSKKYVVHDGNKYGLHLVRALLAERVLEARRSSLPTIDHQHPDIASFRDHGIVVVKTSGLKQQITDPKERADLLRLFQYAAGDDRLVDNSFELYREPVVHQKIDMQHAMHMDSFAATIKVFGFGESVGSLAQGPFHYVNGSHRHTESKLRLIQELMASSGGGGGGGGGSTGDEFSICASPRIYPPQQRKYGIVATPMIVPAGSVVIADTNGFHYRGKGVPGTRRDFWTTRWKHIEWSHRDIPRFSPFIRSGD